MLLLSRYYCSLIRYLGLVCNTIAYLRAKVKEKLEIALRIPKKIESQLSKEQKLTNFLSLSTLRHYVPYASGILNIDKSEYVGITDYEIEFTGKSYHQGKADFIKIISDFGIQYKKSEKKIKRAFNALKNLDDDE